MVKKLVNSGGDCQSVIMFRKQLTSWLLERELSLRELSDMAGESLKSMESDLRHWARSLKHEGYRLVVEPARCRRCGFRFSREKWHKPSRCPCCKGDWIDEPRFHVEA